MKKASLFDGKIQLPFDTNACDTFFLLSIGTDSIEMKTTIQGPMNEYIVIDLPQWTEQYKIYVVNLINSILKQTT